MIIRKSIFTPVPGGCREISEGQKLNRQWHIVINANYTERDVRIIGTFIRSFMQCEDYEEVVDDGQDD